MVQNDKTITFFKKIVTSIIVSAIICGLFTIFFWNYIIKSNLQTYFEECSIAGYNCLKDDIDNILTYYSEMKKNNISYTEFFSESIVLFQASYTDKKIVSCSLKDYNDIGVVIKDSVFDNIVNNVPFFVGHNCNISNTKLKIFLPTSKYSGDILAVANDSIGYDILRNFDVDGDIAVVDPDGYVLVNSVLNPDAVSIFFDKKVGREKDTITKLKPYLMDLISKDSSTSNNAYQLKFNTIGTVHCFVNSIPLGNTRIYVVSFMFMDYYYNLLYQATISLFIICFIILMILSYTTKLRRSKWY